MSLRMVSEFVSTPRFQICMMLNNSSQFGVPSDFTINVNSRPVTFAGWTNISKLIVRMKRSLFSERDTVGIIKIGGQARTISRSRLLLCCQKAAGANLMPPGNNQIQDSETRDE
jgi:hypothetical protein